MGKGYIRDRFKSLITVFIAIAVITLSVVVLVYIPIFLNTAFNQNDVTKAIGDVWLAMRWLVVLSLYFLVISVVFYSLPTWRVPYSEIVPGSLFTSIGLIVVSYLFNFYVNLSTNYDILYGSFANAVALIIWFWIMGWVMVIGIIFNRVWWDVRSENKIPIPEDVIARRSPLGFF
jgi:membrane protein